MARKDSSWMGSRDRTRTLLLAAALPAALALGLVAILGLEAERASVERERSDSARGALEGAAARFAGRCDARLRQAVQRARDVLAAGTLVELSPPAMPGVVLALFDAEDRRIWPREAHWIELDERLDNSSFAVRQALTSPLPADGEELAALELVRSLAGWERATPERALARFRLAQRDGAWEAITEEDLAFLPSAALCATYETRVRAASGSGRAGALIAALGAFEAQLLPMRLPAEAPGLAWLRAIIAEAEQVHAGTAAQHELRARAWERTLGWLEAFRSTLPGVLARAMPEGTWIAMAPAAMPVFATRLPAASAGVRVLVALEPEEEAAELARLSADLRPRVEQLELVPLERASRASAPYLAAGLPGLGAEPLLFARAAAPSAGFPWRTALAGGFLAACFATALGGVWLGARSLRRERTSVEERSAFLARVSHQLKTPVANLRLFAETLASGRASDPEDVRRMQEILGLESERLGGYLERVLSLTRLDAAPLPSNADSIDVGALIAAARPGWELLAARCKVELEIASDAELPRARGDERALVDALQNVVDNALRATPAGGRVRIEARLEGERLVVRIEDGGAGIPAGERERIFERFAQLAGEKRRAGEGTGLGLWIAREGARRCGGTLAVESSSERGTVMRFEIPVLSGAR